MASPERWDKVAEIYFAALELRPDERKQMLAVLSTEAPELLVEVQELLRHGDMEPDFLAQPHPASPFLSRGKDEDAQRRFSPGQVLARRFRVREFLGVGGMGEVYAAEDLDLNEVIALKTLRPELTEERMVVRFKQELQIARRITHPNVCRVFDFATHEDRPGSKPRHFITMELLQGVTLAERLKDGPLPHKDAISFAQQIASGLACAHNLGIIHRDLKTSNIFLVDGNVYTRAVIMDFGLARSASSDTQPSAAENAYVAGSPLYMAPEQFGAGALSAATDVFAFGIVLHEMLTGAKPLGRESLTQILEAGPIPQWELVVHGLDHKWAAFILRCIQADPRKRYRDGQALVKEFESARPLVSRRFAIVGLSATVIGVSAMVFKTQPTTPPWNSPNAEANGLYQKGRLHLRRLTSSDISRALQYFDEAITLDPRFALAYSGRADAYSTLTDYGGKSQREAARLALEAGRKAVELGPGLVETQASLGLAISSNVRLWRQAEPALREAIRLDPNYAPAHHWYGIHLVRLGHLKAAIEHFKRAVALDPVNLPMSSVLGYAYYFDRQYDKAVEQALRTVDLDPNFRYGYPLLARAYVEAGQIPEARAACQRGIQLSGNSPIFATAMACIEFKAGKPQETERVLQQLERRHDDEHIPALYIASLHSLLGNADAAFRWLRRGFDDDESSVLLVGVYPQFDGVRSDPRYVELLREFGLRS